MKAEELSKLSQEQIEDLVVDGEDLQLLYRIDIHLERVKSRIFARLETEKDKKIPLKNELSWADNLMSICKSRQYDLREDSVRFNWRFRVEAQKVLPPETYNKIAEAAKPGGHG